MARARRSITGSAICGRSSTTSPTSEYRARSVVDRMALAIQAALLAATCADAGCGRVLRVAPGCRRSPQLRHAAARRGLCGIDRTRNAPCLNRRTESMLATTLRWLLALAIVSTAARRDGR